MLNEIYIDMLHDQLYVASEQRSGGISAGSSHQITFGLSDFGELPGQSTWHIRSIKFYLMGFQEEAGLSPYSTYRILGGITNRDIASSTNYSELSDYQDIAGFPLKDVQKDGLVLNNPQQNWFSWQKTYRPRKHLSLNREQNFVFCVKSVYGNDLTTQLGMYLHAERGD